MPKIYIPPVAGYGASEKPARWLERVFPKRRRPVKKPIPPDVYTSHNGENPDPDVSELDYGDDPGTLFADTESEYGDGPGA